VELTEEDTLLILACDGVWDVLSNEQAVAIAEAQPTAARASIALRGMFTRVFEVPCHLLTRCSPCGRCVVVCVV
jgi:hypothetical protein